MNSNSKLQWGVRFNQVQVRKAHSNLCNVNVNVASRPTAVKGSGDCKILFATCEVGGRKHDELKPMIRQPTTAHSAKTKGEEGSMGTGLRAVRAYELYGHAGP